MKGKYIKITEVTNKEAKQFFLKNKSYVNFDIPSYCDFSKLLSKADKILKTKNLNDLCKQECGIKSNKVCLPCYYDKVNYEILSNKDGAYAWRPLQIINPLLYLDLVNEVTNEKNWQMIQNKFQEFSFGNVYVDCISVPLISLTEEKHEAHQVKKWWEGIEQESIKLSMEFEFVHITDVSDCYGSIYTHSFEWVFEGKPLSKENMKKGTKSKGLGSSIDKKIRNMTNNQTNGIPQGSKLMDFLAELILGYADVELSKKIDEAEIDHHKFKILRYRDDYRLFTNDLTLGKEILKLLNQTLYELGMKMNPSKTSENSDIITSSIKPEKYERISISPYRQSYQKEALRIYNLSSKYPNAGLISTELSNFYDRISNLKRLSHTNIEVLIAIFTNIAVQSPRVINWIAAVNSLLLQMIKEEDRDEILNKMRSKLNKLANTGLIDIWLQRIAAPMGLIITYKDQITKVVTKDVEAVDLWNFEWLEEKYLNTLKGISVTTLAKDIKSGKINPVIARKEVELFRLPY